MILTHYRTETTRTLPDLNGDLMNSIHMSLGMFTEIAEIIEILSDPSLTYNPYKLMDETGDVLWYLSNYTNVHNLTLTQAEEHIIIPGFLEDKPMLDCILILAAKLADVDKKKFAYGKEPAEHYRQNYAQFLFDCIHMFCIQHQMRIEDVMERNIEKLRTRFPEKFSGEQAINKDEKKEAEVFTKWDGNTVTL